MEKHTKKYMVIIYYTGLIIGAILMNYIVREYQETALSLKEQFQGLDKLAYVKEKELLLYLFYKRAKQLAICSYFYFFIGKKMVLYILDFYFSFVMGVTTSLFVYYNGFLGLIHTVILFLPIVIFYGCIYYMAWLQVFQYSYGGKSTGKKKIVLVLLFLTLGVLAELVINDYLV